MGIEIDYWFNNRFKIRNSTTGRLTTVTVRSIYKQYGMYWAEVTNRKGDYFAPRLLSEIKVVVHTIDKEIDPEEPLI